MIMLVALWLICAAAAHGSAGVVLHLFLGEEITSVYCLKIFTIWENKIFLLSTYCFDDLKSVFPFNNIL